MKGERSAGVAFITMFLLPMLVFALAMVGLYKCGFISFTVPVKQEIVMKPTKHVPDTNLTITIPIRYEYNTKGGGFSVTTIGDVRITAYNNLPEQTNSKPNIGASNRKVFEGSIALSRDIMREYNVRYGDVVCVTERDTCYIVEDTMNARYDNQKSPASGWRADIFMYDRETALKVNFKSDLMLIKQL